MTLKQRGWWGPGQESSYSFRLKKKILSSGCNQQVVQSEPAFLLACPLVSGAHPTPGKTLAAHSALSVNTAISKSIQSTGLE